MRITPAVHAGTFLTMPAKVLCSAVFVSGREPAEAIHNSAFVSTPEPYRDLIEPAIDDAAREVRMTMRLDAAGASRVIETYRALYPEVEADWEAEAGRLRALGSLSRRAGLFGDQGAVILPADGDRVFFEPVRVVSSLPDAMSEPWPMGDRPSDGPLPAGIDAAALERAVAAAFADPEACTAAFLVVYRGEIVAERYAAGVGKDTQLESWSMGKSLTATLLGLLARDGLVRPEEPAPIAAWRSPGDPRAAITVKDLLQMSSGLRFTRDEPHDTWEHAVADHVYVYFEAINVFDFSIDRPPEFPPGTVGRYRNCDPLAIGYIIKQIVTGRGEQYLSWPQRALFDRIGIRRQVLETDIHGNFILTGYDYGTARNWARLGLLYLRDGVWQGTRLLPEGWAGLVSRPAPAWPRPEYGGLFWVNGAGDYELPRSAYSMAGAGEQRVFVVPSHDLVVVRLGHRRGEERAKTSLNEALRLLMAALPAGAGTAASTA